MQPNRMSELFCSRIKIRARAAENLCRKGGKLESISTLNLSGQKRFFFVSADGARPDNGEFSARGTAQVAGKIRGRCFLVANLLLLTQTHTHMF